LLRSATATLYDINWRNTQILGLATTPGVTALITRNTSGVHTQGFEISAELAPARWLEMDFAWSHTNPRFKPGSEDPGSAAFCGISSTNATSSFCTIRQSTIAPGQSVPDVSGNLLLRAVPDSWAGGVTIMPQAGLMRGIRLHAGISHQGNDFERAINGLYFGARTLLDARVSIPLGRFSLDLWGTNLANYRYIRAGAGRQPQFYIGMPRPSDLILGEGRQIGLTLRYER
jgi:iron complex outermembrane recepter protein